MAGRSFPISPRTTQSLKVGDLIAVPCEPSGWACLQVIELKRTGTAATSTFVAGIVPWRGYEPPTRHTVSGLAATEQGLVHVDIFTKGGLRVVDEAEVVPTGLPSNFRDFGVGTSHNVWGWRTAIRKAQAAMS